MQLNPAPLWLMSCHPPVSFLEQIKLFWCNSALLCKSCWSLIPADKMHIFQCQVLQSWLNLPAPWDKFTHDLGSCLVTWTPDPELGSLLAVPCTPAARSMVCALTQSKARLCQGSRLHLLFAGGSKLFEGGTDFFWARLRHCKLEVSNTCNVSIQKLLSGWHRRLSPVAFPN